jgi:hypothetical protein
MKHYRRWLVAACVVASIAPALAFYGAENGRALLWVMVASATTYLLGLAALAWGIYEDGAEVARLAFPILLVNVAGACFVIGCGLLRECFP